MLVVYPGGDWKVSVGFRRKKSGPGRRKWMRDLFAEDRKTWAPPLGHGPDLDEIGDITRDAHGVAITPVLAEEGYRANCKRLKLDPEDADSPKAVARLRKQSPAALEGAGHVLVRKLEVDDEIDRLEQQADLEVAGTLSGTTALVLRVCEGVIRDSKETVRNRLQAIHELGTWVDRTRRASRHRRILRMARDGAREQRDLLLERGRELLRERRGEDGGCSAGLGQSLGRPREVDPR